MQNGIFIPWQRMEPGEQISAILQELGTLYNRARQAAITQEITEVIAGAKAQKKGKN